MKRHYAWLLGAVALSACSSGGVSEVTSPDGKLVVNFDLINDGTPTYSAVYDGREIVASSGMGFQMEHFGALTNGFKVIACHESEHNETWAPV